MTTLFGEQVNSLDEKKIYENLENGSYRSVSDIELIYAIVGNEETAAKVFLSAGKDITSLFRYSIDELMKIPGVGRKKAIALVSAMELGRRRIMNTPDEKPVIRCSRDIYSMMFPHLADLNHEELWAIFINNAGRVIYKYKVSQGGINETTADIRLILKKAIEKLATGIILSHNHPSGQNRPSADDDRLTKRLADSAKVMEIRMLDHVIVTANKYYSYADEGRI